MISCYASECKKGVIWCCALSKECDPRPCGECKRLNHENARTMKKAICEYLDYCEENCPKYYHCDKIAELGDKLNEIEENERKNQND